MSLIKVVVDRSKWYRGRELGSALLRYDGMMCCLGFAMLAAGAVPADILRVGMPAGAGNPALLPTLSVVMTKNLIDLTGQPFYTGGWQSTLLASSLARINDDTSITDEVRERRLKKKGLEADLEFEFV